MENFAKNITVSENIIKRQEFNTANKGITRLYPCWDDCTKIDLIFIDNGIEVFFTLDEKQTNESGPDMIIYPKEIRMDDQLKTFITAL